MSVARCEIRSSRYSYTVPILLPPDISEREYVLQALKLPDVQIHIVRLATGIIHYYKGSLTDREYAAYQSAVADVEQNRRGHIQRAINVLEASEFDVALAW